MDADNSGADIELSEYRADSRIRVAPTTCVIGAGQAPLCFLKAAADPVAYLSKQS